MLATALLAAFAVMLVSLSGKLLTWRGVGPLIERNLHFFVSFASGVLLIVTLGLSQEIVEHAGSLTAGLPWIAIGAVVVLIAFRYIPQFHHHHESGHHAHSKIDANRIIASDALHNVTDGAVITLAFAAAPALGIVTTVSIMVHEMLQEISEFFVLREAGLSVRRALTVNFLSSAAILVGVFASYYLLEQFEAIEIPLLGLAAGSYLVVVFHDLIPHAIETAFDRRHVLRHLFFFLLGLGLMALLSAALPHEEPEAEARAAAPNGISLVSYAHSYERSGHSERAAA